MRGNLQKKMIELAGFALIGMVFFVWFLGRQKNTLPARERGSGTEIMQANAATPHNDRMESTLKEPDTENTWNSNDYTPSRYEEPKRVTGRQEQDHFVAAGETAIPTSATRSTARESRKEAATAEVLRSWKGVHRDASFARLTYERYGGTVSQLAKEYGLYPEILMARIIAYSYEYVSHPDDEPIDHNLTAMKRPDGEERARFRSSLESLKAYAVVNAGETAQFTLGGALAKHDRAWTLQKIIENYDFISHLRQPSEENAAYSGNIGPANRMAPEERHQKELEGEAIRMVSNIDKKVKERQAKKAGYDSWEDYVEDLPEDQQKAEEKKAVLETSAISKKKAVNLGRRVNGRH